jgi:hypothetical protein
VPAGKPHAIVLPVVVELGVVNGHNPRWGGTIPLKVYVAKVSLL